MVFDNKINKIEENVDRNITETYQHNDGNNGTNFRHFKFIGFFINNRLCHSKYLTKAIIMI